MSPDLEQLLATVPASHRALLCAAVRRGRNHFELRLAQELLKAELEAGSRYFALFPCGTQVGEACVPERHYALGVRGPHDALRLARGMRVLKVMTHPADARAGWCLVGNSLRFHCDCFSPFQEEVRFDAFHWALSKVKLPWDRREILEEVYLQAAAVLHAPEARPMTHGLWVKVYDMRGRSTSANDLERLVLLHTEALQPQAPRSALNTLHAFAPWNLRGGFYK